MIKFERSNKSQNSEKLVFSIMGTTASQCFKDLSDENFFMLHNEMFQHLRSYILNNFLNEKCGMLQNHTWVNGHIHSAR